ncbi:radical SAM family heme chaperone HemW [Prosthecobacter fusiformis]|uniref:radical SAM family heme chaperone HemW n=1 Tax=Prosthecobacter fusiformis TaxID=48464 RepID=UPI001415161C|nr:radical SAM family heme chaperone HemW [Prosthecobacter fusiformis]
MIQHLYVHIPFCHRICPYCSFYKHQHGSTDMAGFVEAVLTEARREQAARAHELDLHTVYLGGGTPTALSETHLERLLTGLGEIHDLSRVAEYTSEVNPRTITAAKAAMMRRCGVTRISLGIQAWDEPTLKTLGRDHAPADAEETYQLLRGAGFDSVSLDLMFSIPGQSLEAWRGTLERTVALEPNHISAYNLNYEEDTEFFQRLRKGQYREDEGRDAEFFYLALDVLEAGGYQHYEISNYARPGYRSAHNESYWMGEEYLGLGPSAYSTAGGQRWQNIPDTARYMELSLAGLPTAQPGEELTEDRRRTERFGLELRTLRGLPQDLVLPDQRRMLQTLAEEGLLNVEKGHIILTRQGKPLVDSIAVALMG